MTNISLDELEYLERKASPGPWSVYRADDDYSMSAVIISKNEISGAKISMRFENWPHAEVVAITLLQKPPAAIPSDGLWDENATLIAAVRNTLPELLRLARIGLDRETR